MKKFLLAITSFVTLTLPLMALAVEDVPTLDVFAALDRIINYLFAILMVIAAICIIIAGINFATAAGDADKVKKARDYVLYAIVGVAVGLLSRGLVALIKQIIKGGGGTTISI